MQESYALLAKLTTEQKAIFDRIIDSKKAIFTPHIAGWTFESYVKINEVLVEKISTILE
jgi:D-3-phosphoglycerate dehydrogenase